MMKKLIYKIIYNPFINSCLRPAVKSIYRLTGKKAMSVSGKVNFQLNDIRFALLTNQSSAVTNYLFFYEPVNYEFTSMLIDLIKSQKVFLDIGANIGYFSVLGSKSNPDCRIFAFEPSVGSHHFLKQNIALNDCKNVTVIDKAISDIDGTLEFNEVTNRKYPWLEYNLNGSNSLAGHYISRDFRSYDVQVTTLEKVVKDHDLESVDLIKLDTEYTEHMILNCSVETINKYKPIIICEVYPEVEKEMDEILTKKIVDYKIYQWLQESHTLQIIESFSEVDENDGNRNFIFCHKERINQLDKYMH